MAKSRQNQQRKSAKESKNRALNAFNTAVDDDYYIKGLRQQQDIDLDQISDERIRDLLSNQVNSEDDEDIDSDEAMGSASDISLGEPESEDEDAWGDSVDEDELLPLSEVWDINNENSDEASENGTKKPAPEIKKASGTEVEYSNQSDSPDNSESDSESASEEEHDSIGLSDSQYGSTENESEDEEDNSALRQAIKNISGKNNAGVSNSRLVEAEAENPFALPQTSHNESVTLENFVPIKETAKTLSIPAPQRIQERANREVAYDLAKEEVNKWSETVAANRRAEHLQFPINPPPEFHSASPFTATDSANRNQLEDKVAQILNASHLADEKQASTFEEMAPSKLSIEELKQRRNQLRYMRDLMFREEQRAKRIKKIKSKTYRKIHKKERERMAELENEDDEGEDESKLERAERDRALERATLRHKANSKWAKRMLEQGLTKDSGTRAEIEEMLRQSDALRQKIRGTQDEDEDFDDAHETFDDAEEPNSNESNESRKGVLGMKFMRDAEKREFEANKRLMRDDFDSQSEDENMGRKSFNPANQQLKRDLEAMEKADDKEETGQVPETNSKKRNKEKKPERGDEVIELRQNENLNHSRDKQPKRKSRTEDLQDVANANPENPWLKATANSRTPGTVKLAAASKSNGKDTNSGDSKNPRNAKIVVENTFGDSLVREKDLTLQQQDLVRQAFAGDDVVSQFNEEKQAEIDEDKDKDIDETLPGWGSWSNEKPRIQKVRKVIGVNEKQRRDYKKSDVIINEKLNKKAAKYNASAVPFPFENRQQYERSLRMPIGQEWVTKDTFQRQTKPRVLVKRGSVIDPIKKPRSNH